MVCVLFIYMFMLNNSLMPDKKAILYNLKNPVLARLKSFPNVLAVICDVTARSQLAR